MWTTTRSKRQLDSCCLNSDLICIFSLFWQVEDLDQQVECSDIEVLPDVSEKEVNTKKCKSSNKKLVCLFVDWNINKSSLSMTSLTRCDSGCNFEYWVNGWNISIKYKTICRVELV